MADLITTSYATAHLPSLTAAQSAILGDLVSAASAAVERYCDRVIAAADLDEWYSGGCHGLYLRERPINSIASIAVGTVNPRTLDPSTYGFDRRTGQVWGAGWSNEGWGWSSGYGAYLGDWGSWAGDPFGARESPRQPLVRVRYNAGYNPVPPNIQQATVLMVKAMAESLVISKVLQSETIADYSYTVMQHPFGISPDVMALLAPYKVYRL